MSGLFVGVDGAFGEVVCASAGCEDVSGKTGWGGWGEGTDRISRRPIRTLTIPVNSTSLMDWGDTDQVDRIWELLAVEAE